MENVHSLLHVEELLLRARFMGLSPSLPVGTVLPGTGKVERRQECLSQPLWTLIEI